MKVNEIIEASVRFRSPSKSAIFNGEPADPKKILMAFKNSLNRATEMNWKMKPVSISEMGYIGEFRFHEWQDETAHGPNAGRKQLTITVKVTWYQSDRVTRPQTMRKPRIELNLFNSHDEMNLINYRVELDDETVANMWGPMTVKTIHEYMEEEEDYYATDDEEDEEYE